MFAQPAVSRKIPPQLVGLNGTNIDLGVHFASVPAAGTGVKVTTPFGSFIMELLPQDAPLTVENFLSYVDNGAYDNVMVHRSAPGFVIQTGAYKADEGPTAIPTRPPVTNEFRVSNTRGTVAMARVGGQTNSATSQWFVNLGNNSFLDSVDGGFTVFARVRGDGMSIVDKIADLPVITNFAPPFNELPLRGLQAGQTNISVSNFVPLQSVARLPFLVRNSNPDAWSVSLPPGSSVLAIRPGSQAAKASTITIEATDLDGRVAVASFVVKASPALRYAGTGNSQVGAAGMILNSLPSGSFSAVFSSASGTKRLKGAFDRAGVQSTELILDTARRMALRFDPATDVFILSSGGQSFRLRPAAWPSAVEDSPLDGKLFNALLDYGASGWAQLLFDRAGAAKITGRLADGTAFTSSSFCVVGENTSNPVMPIAVFPKAGASAAVSGTLMVDVAQPQPALTGELSRDRRAGGSEISVVAGAPWVPLAKDRNALDGMTAGSVEYELRFTSVASESPLFVFRAQWPSSNRPAAPREARVSSLKFSAATGQFAGRVFAGTPSTTGEAGRAFSGLVVGGLPGADDDFRGGGFVSGATGGQVWSLHVAP